MTDEADWYYEYRGERVGPVSVQGISQKRREGVINDKTLVWHPEFGEEWRPLGSLNRAESSREEVQAPVIRSRSVRNGLAWLFVLWPLIFGYGVGAVIHVEFGTDLPNWAELTAIAIGCVIFATFDRRRILRAGYGNVPSEWWGILSPIYFRKRNLVLGRGQALFWTGTVLFVLVVGLDLLGMTGIVNF